MGSFVQYLVSAVQIVAGGILAYFGNPYGVPLIVSGAAGFAATFLTAPGNSSLASSPTYGFDELGNHRGEGEPIPVVYGEHMLTPLAISTLVDNDDDGEILLRGYLLGRGRMKVFEQKTYTVFGKTGTINSSFRKLLGGIETSDIYERCLINDVPIRDIDPDATVVVRHGDATETVVPGFDQTGRPQPITTTKLEQGSSFLYTMNADSDAIYMRFVWPGGIYKSNGKGGAGQSASGVKFEYRIAGTTGPWKAMDLLTNTESSPLLYTSFGSSPSGLFTPVSQKDKPGTLNPKWWPKVPEDNIKSYQKGTYYVKGNTRSTVRVGAKFYFPEGKDTYQIRLTGTNFDDNNDVRTATIQQIIEIENTDAQTYDGLATVWVRLRATPQLGNREPTFKMRTLGREVYNPVTALTEWTDNAAWCIRDFILNATFGLGQWLDSSDMDEGVGGTWRDYAESCDESETVETNTGEAKTTTEARHRLNLVVDTRAPARDWLNQMSLASRASIFSSEGLIKVSYDDVTAVVDRTFETREANESNRKNVKVDGEGRSTLRLTGVERREHYNRVRVRYVDRDRGWAEKTVTIPDVDDPVVGVTEPEVAFEIFLLGCTGRGEAKRMGDYFYNLAQYSRWFAQFQVAWGDLDLEPGDLVRVYSEWPEWPSDYRDFKVLTSAFTPDGGGTLVGREYSSSVFGSTVKPLEKQYKPTGSDDVQRRAPRNRDFKGSVSWTGNQVTVYPRTAPIPYPSVKATDIIVTVIQD